MKQFLKIRTVAEIQMMPAAGPWSTKSGGNLEVLMKVPMAALNEQYFSYDSEETDRLSQDIRGLRIYTVRDLPQDKIGGMEWHRIREEMVFSLEGSVLWICEDALGNKREFTLDSGMGIWVPPGILHTYRVLEEGSGLLVVANTLFIPEDASTHDTYSLEDFHELQKQLK